MEGIMVNHQRRRKVIKSPEGFESDHIIPFCISLDNSKGNIQFLTHEEHIRKSVIDRKILKEFRENGWIEKITNYSIELMINLEKLKMEYQKRYNEKKDE